jgi:GNAT superfamily N-acetyltransferase
MENRWRQLRVTAISSSGVWSVSAHRVRIAGRLDLPALNVIIRHAVASWDATERVKRLAVPVYQYRQDDLDHMWLLVAEGSDRKLLGLAALEEADGADVPSGGPGLLLHGIYVKPPAMGLGIGAQLVAASAGITRALGCDGLLVKSVRHSRGFFAHCGMQSLPAVKFGDYPYRYWLPGDSAVGVAAVAG